MELLQHQSKGHNLCLWSALRSMSIYVCSHSKFWVCQVQTRQTLPSVDETNWTSQHAHGYFGQHNALWTWICLPLPCTSDTVKLPAPQVHVTLTQAIPALNKLSFHRGSLVSCWASPSLMKEQAVFRSRSTLACVTLQSAPHH